MTINIPSRMACSGSGCCSARLMQCKSCVGGVGRGEPGGAYCYTGLTDGSQSMAKLFTFLLHCNLKNFGDVRYELSQIFCNQEF